MQIFSKQDVVDINLPHSGSPNISHSIRTSVASMSDDMSVVQCTNKMTFTNGDNSTAMIDGKEVSVQVSRVV